MRARCVVLLAVVVACGGLSAGAQEGDFIQGSLHVVPKPGERLLEFPLKHTDVQADIAGMVAHVTVTQEYENPFDRPIEAV